MYSIVEYFYDSGESEGHKCGYCKKESSFTKGVLKKCVFSFHFPTHSHSNMNVVELQWGAHFSFLEHQIFLYSTVIENFYHFKKGSMKYASGLRLVKLDRHY